MLRISYSKEQGTPRRILINKERIGSQGNKKKQINQRFDPRNKDYSKVQGWLQVTVWRWKSTTAYDDIQGGHPSRRTIKWLAI